MCSLLEDIVKRSEKARASSEEFQIFIRAQGGFRLFLDHKLVMSAWQGTCRVQ